jgi:hypothetical protein
MDIHTTSSSTEITDARYTWRDSQLFQTAEALRPWLQWAMIGLLALSGMYLYQRDTNAQQVVNVGELQRKHDILQKTFEERTAAQDKRITELKDTMVTQELFEERTVSIKQQIGIVDNRTIEILNRLPLRSP